MSLDVMLYGGQKEVECHACGRPKKERVVLYESNITHNLNKMAEEANIYMHLWRPEEIGIRKAKQLIDPLTKGLHRLKSKPDHFKAFNAPNGWGTYEDFVPWVQEYLMACIDNPEADVVADR